MENTVEKQLGELIADQKAFVARANEEFKTFGSASTETKEALAKLQTQVNAIDEKFQSIEIKKNADKPLEQELKENESYARLMKDRRGSAVITLKGAHALAIQSKTTITSDIVGRMTTGVLPIDRTAGIVAEARRQLRLRQVLASRPTVMQVVDYVKVNSPLSNAAEQSPEGAAKSENAVTFTSVSERVKTVATWIPASKQILADWSELESFLRTGLAYYTEKDVEEQLIFGNGTGETLNGLYSQATAFNTALLPGTGAGSWTPIDVLGWAAAQVAIANEIDPTFALLNPQDVFEIRLAKDSQGRYILGDPWSAGVPNLFGMLIVPSTAMTAGTFLIGSGDPAANEIRQRMEVTVEISTEHSDYFTKNLVAIRAEERLAQVTYRPASFIRGSLSSSPAV